VSIQNFQAAKATRYLLRNLHDDSQDIVLLNKCETVGVPFHHVVSLIQQQLMFQQVPCAVQSSEA
jgi:hypothetical protein